MERVVGLREIGLDETEIADTLGVDHIADLYEQDPIDVTADRRLNQLRMVAAIALQKGMSPEDIASWMRTPNESFRLSATPLQVISTSKRGNPRLELITSLPGPDIL